jgi:hypothetical protein
LVKENTPITIGIDGTIEKTAELFTTDQSFSLVIPILIPSFHALLRKTSDCTITNIATIAPSRYMKGELTFS